MKVKKLKIYAFIDSQNLNLGVRSLGWKLDFKKFRRYLFDKFRVDKAFLFLGYVKQYKNLYRMMRNFGYELVFKPTIKNNKGEVKGNVDAEIVLHSAAIEYKNYKKAVIVSGDGDFYCLYEFLNKNNKLSRIIIPNHKSESSLLKPFQEYKSFVIFEKNKLIFEKNKSGRRCK